MSQGLFAYIKKGMSTSFSGLFKKRRMLFKLFVLANFLFR